MKLTERIFELSCPWDNPYQGKQQRMLFVCSAGLLRSATAATIASQMGINARNCGSHLEYALIPISVNLVFWAEKIVFVNPENYSRAKKMFFGDMEALALIDKKSIVWDIEDDFRYMDPTLVGMVQDRLLKILN